jgi:hypothetical protein
MCHVTSWRFVDWRCSKALRQWYLSYSDDELTQSISLSLYLRISILYCDSINEFRRFHTEILTYWNGRSAFPRTANLSLSLSLFLRFEDLLNGSARPLQFHYMSDPFIFLRQSSPIVFRKRWSDGSARNAVTTSSSSPPSRETSEEAHYMLCLILPWSHRRIKT